LHVALGTLTYGRIGVGASGVGMAQSAFDECIEYMKEREAFGKKRPISVLAVPGWRRGQYR